MNLIHTVTLLVCLSAGFSYLNHRFIKLPMAIGLMAIALLMSLALLILGKMGFVIEQEAESFIQGVDFNVALLGGMLSLLLFAGALHVNLDDLLEQKWSIGVLSSLGVVLSTLVTGLLTLYLFGLIGLDLPLLSCFLFGALISPTDPIAVLGILKKAGVPKSLEVKITGESLFNDGVGVVVFLALLTMASTGGTTAADVLLLFVQETAGGAVIGLALGYLAYRMLKSVDQHQVELLITLALAMGSYALADVLHTSGPIAVVVAGLFIGNHGRTFAMSDTTLEYLDTFWELVDELLNAVLFVLIGLEVLVLSFRPQYLEAGLIAIPVVLLARAISVGIPMRLFGLLRLVNTEGMGVKIWGGLRGGISVALALSLPPGETRDALLTVTYAVVAFSILVQGLTLGRAVSLTSRASVEA